MKIKMKEFFNKYLCNSVSLCIVLAIVLDFIIEAAGRRSISLCLQYIWNSPMTFFYNAFLIFITFSIAYFVKRRSFVYVIVSMLWLAIGIVNCVLLGCRITPFTVADLWLLNDAIAILPSYMSTFQMILAGAGAVVLIIALVLIFIFAPKHKRKINYKKSLIGLATIVACVFGFSHLAVATGWVSTNFANLNYAYKDYGVPYCFINTWLNTGISQPKNYANEQIQGIFDKGELNANDTTMATVEPKDDDSPNIIIVQLESFFDPTQMEGVEFSQDPVPNFRALEQNYSSGYLTVPVVGAGTANTEFEVLTGMSIRFFGPGEYPYKSILTKTTCESICYDLKKLGYSAHAIHNHRASFYGRNEVFANLGFDTFTSAEYMNNIIKTDKGFEKDDILTGEIMAALQSTANKDLVYTISVQDHGEYPTTKIDNPTITVTGIDDESECNAFEYYLQELNQTDAFIGALVKELRNYDEDTVLVLYGDHLPYLNIAADELTNNNLYQTPYVIWSNFDMTQEDKDLYAYQISAEVMKRVGINTGVLTKYHQDHAQDRDYLANLDALQYDMLYGKQYIYGETNPYLPTDLHMGVRKIKIDNILKANGKYFVIGENFTPFSKVTIDGKLMDTEFVSPTTLQIEAEDIDLDEIQKIKVSQIEKKNNSILSTTE